MSTLHILSNNHFLHKSQVNIVRLFVNDGLFAYALLTQIFNCAVDITFLQVVTGLVKTVCVWKYENGAVARNLPSDPQAITPVL